MITKQDPEQGENNLQEEIRKPLILVDKASADEEDGYAADQTHKSIKRHEWMVYLSTFFAVCGSYAFGACAGYSSPTQSGIMEDLSLSLAEYSLFGSILTFGAMVGAITIGPIADYIGRKGAMRVSSSFCVAGWLAIYFAEGPLPLDIGRLATGYGMGAFSYVVPVFIAEIAPKNLRGALTTLNQVMICCGVSVSFIIGTVLKWRVLALTGEMDLFHVPLWFWVSFFIPESPRWLAKVGRQKDFEVALQRLRGKDADISEEKDEIQVPITALGAPIIDRVGRKPLILVSASGLVVGCMLTGFSFYLKVHEIALDASPILAVTGILVYIGSFSIGMGAVPWVVMSEIFPINVKGVAGGLATLVNWFIAWLESYTFNFLMSWSSYGTFILYGAVNALAIVFVVKVVPETKGKTLEQIQAAINA
ncbi:major facilitator superfamily protein [Actinidia rufa]|uniref:Major facilitator superfamily protein n=1 Tax=Actinidia rufa TaxID=165716 RepID=A0A7J0FJL3_9ERIC|nr:major facilitator superfamily protein [Actinidia rufa]